MTRLTLPCILFTSPAWAADTPVVAVVGIHQNQLDAGAQEVLHARIVESLDATGTVDALPAADVAAAIAGRESVILGDALLGEGRRFLADGTNLYNQAVPEDAIPVLEKAIEALGFGLAASNTTKELWEAWMMLGTCQHAADRPTEARASWQKAAALNPGRAPSPALYPPDVVAGFTAARALLDGSKRALSVSAPANATIWVDGVEQGAAPVTVADLLAGTHHVVARGDGRTGYAAIDLQAGSVPFELDVQLGAPTLGGASGTVAGRARQTAWLYRGVGQHAQGVDVLLVAGTDGSDLYLQWYLPKVDAFSTPIQIPVQGDADDEVMAALPALVAQLDASGGLATDRTSPSAAPLAVGANSYLAALLLDPRAPASVTVDEGGRRRTGLIAAIAGGGGLALVAGGVLAAVALGGSDVPPDGGTIIVGPF